MLFSSKALKGSGAAATFDLRTLGPDPGPIPRPFRRKGFESAVADDGSDRRLLGLTSADKALDALRGAKTSGTVSVNPVTLFLVLARRFFSFSSAGATRAPAGRLPLDSGGADAPRMPGSLLPVLRGRSLYVLFRTNEGFVFSFLSSAKLGTDLLNGFSISLLGGADCGLLGAARTCFGALTGTAGELAVPRNAPTEAFFGGESLRAALGFPFGVSDGVGISVGNALGVDACICFSKAFGVELAERAEAVPPDGGLGLLRAAILSRLWFAISSSRLASSSSFSSRNAV